MLYHQNPCFKSKIIYFKFINRYYHNLFTNDFVIKKTRKPIDWKYHWPSLRKDVKAYIKHYNIYWVLKAVRYTSYNNL